MIPILATFHQVVDELLFDAGDESNVSFRCLKRPLLIQMLKQIPLVRLIPRNAARRNRAKVETVYI